MTLGVSDLQSDSDLDSIRNACDVYFYYTTTCTFFVITIRHFNGASRAARVGTLARLLPCLHRVNILFPVISTVFILYPFCSRRAFITDHWSYDRYLRQTFEQQATQYLIKIASATASPDFESRLPRLAVRALGPIVPLLPLGKVSVEIWCKIEKTKDKKATKKYCTEICYKIWTTLGTAAKRCGWNHCIRQFKIDFKTCLSL